MKIKNIFDTFKMLKKNKKSLPSLIQMLSPETIDIILETIYNLVFNKRFKLRLMKYKEYNILRKRMFVDKKLWLQLLTKKNNIKKKKLYMVSQQGGSIIGILAKIISIIPTLISQFI